MTLEWRQRLWSASVCTLAVLTCRAAKTKDTHEQSVGTLRLAERDGPPVPSISADSIGSIRVNASLGALRRQFLGVLDTTWEVGEGYPPHAALKFSVKGLTAIASQFSASIDLTKPAEAWMVPVGDALLPGGLRMRATWGDLRRAYGGRATLASNDLLPGVRFCSLPRLIFYLSADGNAIEVDSLGPTNIPLGAPLEEVEIIRGIVGFDVCATAAG